jgi:hypothetical protein
MQEAKINENQVKISRKLTNMCGNGMLSHNKQKLVEALITADRIVSFGKSSRRNKMPQSF